MHGKLLILFSKTFYYDVALNIIQLLFLLQVYRRVVSGEPLMSGASCRLGAARGQFQLHMTVADFLIPTLAVLAARHGSSGIVVGR